MEVPCCIISSSLDTRVTNLERQLGITQTKCDISLAERIGTLENRMGISLSDRVAQLEQRHTMSDNKTRPSLKKDYDDDATQTYDAFSVSVVGLAKDELTCDEATWKTPEAEDKQGPMLPFGIYKTDDWKTVWNKLKQSGWMWKRGTGLKTFYYIKPGSTIKGGTEFVDYWTTEEDIQNHLLITYGWIGRRNIHSKT
jgi:hypothetical protein